jgi:phage baseplate assembly protein W
MSDSSFLGTGWSFPPTFEVNNYRLNMTHKQDNISQSIDLILQTNQGERSLMPQFGSSLRSFLFRPFDAPLQNEIIAAVKSALLEYEPRIIVNNVILEPLTGNLSGVAIYIDYTLKITNSRFNHVYPFVLNDATNLVTNAGKL